MHNVRYAILDMPLKGTSYTNYARNFIEFSPIGNAALFISGIVLARMLVCLDLVGPLRTWQTYGVSASLVLTLVLMLTVEPPGFDTGTHELLASKGPALFPIFAALIVATSTTPCKDRFLGNRLAQIGDWGFGSVAFPLYVLHMPVHMVLGHIFPDNYGPFYSLWLEPLVQICFATFCGATIDTWTRAAVKEWMSPTSTKNKEVTPVELSPSQAVTDPEASATTRKHDMTTDVRKESMI